MNSVCLLNTTFCVEKPYQKTRPTSINIIKTLLRHMEWLRSGLPNFVVVVWPNRALGECGANIMTHKLSKNWRSTKRLWNESEVILKILMNISRFSSHILVAIVRHSPQSRQYNWSESQTFALGTSEQNLVYFNRNLKDYLRRFMTMGEIWIRHYTPESREESKQ